MHKSLTPLLGSSSAINARKNLAILSQANPVVRSPDPFFRHHREKWKNAVWHARLALHHVNIIAI